MEADKVHDKQIQQQLNKQFFKDPQLPCEAGNIIEAMCLNPECVSALFCHNKQCKSCSGQHTKCKTIELKQITKQLNKRVQDHKDFILKMVEIDNILISQLRRTQRQIVKRYHFQDLAIEHQAIVNKMYRRRNTNVTGDDTRQFEYALRELNEKSHDKIAKELIHVYKEQMQKITEKVVSLKLQMPGADKFQHSPIIDSIVFNKTKNMFQKIKYMVGHLNYPKDFRLIFRASEHGFRADAFHDKCNNIMDTLTLVRTQFGKTIAGYTHYKWGQVGNGWGVQDSKRRACLFQLDHHQKLIPISDQDLIFNEAKCGPVFGRGNDLCISNNCDKNRHSFCNIPTTYNRDSVRHKYAKGEESSVYFSGARNFRVEQYEVYQIIYDSKIKHGEDSCNIQ